LVDGGFNADSANAPPWLYDPATDKWTLAGGGSEVRPRLFALPDGRALALAGQYGTNNVRIGVSIFDPRAGTWVLGRLGPEWPTANFAHLVAGATLGDGRILALGGQLEPGGAIVATVFDPSSITWSPTAAPSNPPYEGATLTVLQDGRVLLAGGTVLSDSPPRGGPTAHAELYDPDRGTWSPTADMVSPRSGHTATLLRDGRVLVVGGITRAGALATAELYDPRTGAWQPTSSIGS